ncbi:MAG: hypothetical protein WCX73_05270 [Candidatus Pacearchaeota archaeon]|jgi:hypothetical protein
MGEFEHARNMFKLEKEFFIKKTDLTIESAKDREDSEHAYHKDMAEREANIKILDKEIELKKQYKDIEVENTNLRNEKELLIKSFNQVIDEKNASIERLDGLVKVLATKMPNVDLKNMNINVESSK